ncbi:MAG: hypothetical protein JHC87_10325 [Thermoleophilaceae bacterium]|nr:hypothetical protein [Thermoleophilaceae bacterium]
MELERAQYEELFHRAGLPLLIENRSAREDVWTRVAPVLAFVFWLELFGAADLSWSTWANVAALSAGLGILLLAWAGGNRMRGRKPFARPHDIGKLELAGFVVVPALLPAVLNGQTTSALVTALVNATILLLLYAIAALGLMSIIRWGLRHAAQQMTNMVMLFARAIPLLLIFSVVLFLTNEVWQVFASISDLKFILTLAALVAAGVSFLVAQIPKEVRALEKEVAEGPPLTKWQRFNVGLVMFVAQSLQALIVSLAVGAFFVLFGVIALNVEVVTGWLGYAPTVIASSRFAGESFVLTDELLRVATAIAALSGLYYAIAVLTEPTYRAQFLADLTQDMRTTFAARARYLALI